MLCWISRQKYITLKAAIKRLRAERNYYKKLAEDLERALKDAIFENSIRMEDDLK